MSETTTTEHNPLEWHTAALAGQKPPTHEGEPQCGYFKRRMVRGGPFVPAAIWRGEDGELVCSVDGRPRDPVDEWTFLAGQPVTYGEYEHHTKHGQWPNTDAEVVQLDDNRGPEDGSPEAIEDQIDSALAGVEKYAEITDDNMAATAQTLRDRLNTLSRTADKTREAEVRPHLDAQKSVNGIWQPIVKKAKAGADTIRNALKAHENRKFKAEQEARRKAEEEQRRKDVEAAAAAKAGEPAPEPDPKPDPAPEPVDAKTQIKGGVGRAATVKVIKVAYVDDQDAAYAFLKDHKELSELIGKLAQRAVDAGHEVPGVRVEEERDVR